MTLHNPPNSLENPNITITSDEKGGSEKKPQPKEKKQRKKNKKRKRCGHSDCNKKLKLSDMMCHCKTRFCSRHRLPEMHECSWDPKGKEEMDHYIEKAGLVESIKFSKLQTI
jgi:predicted nucleic acid binding AN1-type Zn finger protein